MTAMTLRTYGSKRDAYAVFRQMLDRGAPPDDWPALSKAARAPRATARLGTTKPT
ncbi:MAG: type II toxin-antitoxin system YhaV family toxin [Deltaproteobacteria bacterium]